MSLLELIARADERGLAASAVACLDRCLPPPDDRDDPEPLRTLWAGCENGAQWAGRLDAVQAALESAAGTDATTARVRALLGGAPRDFAAGPLRAWADACSLLAVDVHREFDFPAVDGTAESLRLRAGGTDEAGPLVTGELRRQAEILESLAGAPGPVGGGTGLRRVLDLSTEGRRVLRAVMSRRARGRGRPGDVAPQ
ncbi:hypothetical protein [Streptomyces sp. HB132]|uniref:hypothetical protein n=1 Tax=Streptomyces sp. HB132 TaxID=767388 RepID=UPI00195FB5AD|nr:hypothetical protein [Streptomyces sp. HB132]MBM7437197.1 hypothetical protein [Streptomyces sp. HB132]